MASNYHGDEHLLAGALRTGGRLAADGVWKLTKWGLGQVGIVISWKVILVVVIIILIIATIFAGYASIVTFSQGVGDASEIWDNDSYQAIEKDVNNAEYIKQLIVDGMVDTTQGAMGMVEFQDLYDILTAVTDRETANTEEITIEYESEIWTRVLDGEGEYSNEFGQWDNTGEKETSNKTLVRNDLEAEGGNSAYSNSYMLRWQPILVLCIMRAQHEAGNWGYDEWVGEGELDYNDYFLTDEMIDECIAVFDYEFGYYFDFFGQMTHETVKSSYKFDDFYSYRILDGRLSDTQGNTALRHVPVSAPAYVRNSYITIHYNLEDAKLETRTLRYTPHKFISKLEAAAGGHFDETEFLMLLSALPGTEDLVEEYRMIFTLADTYATDDDIPETEEALLYTIYVNTYDHGGGQGDIQGEYFSIMVPSYEKGGVVHEGMEAVFPHYSYDRKLLCQPDASGNYTPGVGDCMTEEEIAACIEMYEESSFYEIQGLEKAFLKLQEDTHVYIPAVLAIIKQEGAAKKGNSGAKHGNFFNYTPTEAQITSGWYYTVNTSFGPRNFLDVQAMLAAEGYTDENCEDYGGLKGYCLYYVVKKQIVTNYINKGQDSLFFFCWWYSGKYEQDGRIIEKGDTVTNEWLSHCYCPWWDDSAWGYSVGGLNNGGGWSGRCTEYMIDFERRAGDIRR